MFIKYFEDFNPKIEYKMIFAINPLCDPKKDYYELKAIFYEGIEPYSSQGKSFEKVLLTYQYIKNKVIVDIDVLNKCGELLETTLIDEDKILKILKEYNLVSSKDIIYQATWFFQNIIKNKMFNEKSNIIAVLFLNAVLVKNKYLPIIFFKEYLNFLENMIFSNITANSLVKLLSVFEDATSICKTKYKKQSKKEIIDIIEKNKKELINKFNVKKLWLYGSFVRDDSNEYSDIDLCVDIKSETTEEMILELIYYLEKQIGRRVDLQIESIPNKNFSKLSFVEREVLIDDSK